MRKLTSLLLILACTLPAYSRGVLAAEAESADSDLPGDSRIKLLMYNESDVYTINTRYGYQTNIVFAPEEELQTISVGDRSLWQIIPAGNRIFIRPLEEGTATNMTILTNRHAYQFDLKSESAEKPLHIVYVAKFVYPERHKPAPEMAMAPPAPMPAPAPSMPAYVPPPPVMASPPVQSAPPVSTGSNYSYTYSGPDNLAPLEVYDDGKATYIKLRDAHQPMPDPYVVDASRNEKPLSYAYKDNVMIIDRVVGELELKSADGTIHIYNEILDPR